MKKIYEFNGLNRRQKNRLKKDYFAREWKNLLLSYLFIVMSSSKTVFSSKNGAIFVFIWFTLVILMSVYAYVSQNDYMYSKKKARRYSKKHKNIQVEKGTYFSPEIGGWNFIGMQVLVAIIVYIVALPISFYLQFKNLEVYKADNMDFFIGILADTYIVALFNVILQIFIEFLYDCTKDKETLKKTIYVLKLKNVIAYVGAIIILSMAFNHYFNKEFEGLFGEVARRIMGGIYIVFMLFPLIKCIKEITINKNKTTKM